MSDRLGAVGPILEPLPPFHQIADAKRCWYLTPSRSPFVG